MSKKADLLKSLYYLYGKEEFLIKKKLSELSSHLSTEAQEFNFEQFRAGEASPQEIVSAASALPFLSDRRLVVVWQAQRLSKTAVETLSPLLADPPAHLCLIFVAEEGAKVEKTRLFRLCQEKGQVVACNSPKRSSYVPWITKEFSKRGQEVGGAVATYVLDRIGPDFYRLQQEIEKLSLHYAQQQKINMDEARSLLEGPAEGTVFQMIDALSQKRVSEALRILDALFRNHEDTSKVLYLLVRHFRLLMKTKALLERGIDGKELGSKISPGRPIQPWVVNKLRVQARNLSFSELRRGLRLLLEADIVLKSSDSDAHVIVEDFIFQLFSSSEPSSQRI